MSGGITRIGWRVKKRALVRIMQDKKLGIVTLWYIGFVVSGAPLVPPDSFLKDSTAHAQFHSFLPILFSSLFFFFFSYFTFTLANTTNNS